MGALDKPVYVFGEFQADANRRVLLRNGEPVPVSAKVFDALIALLEHRGQVVEKDVLLARLWPDTVVEERNLAVHISTLRKALGESAQDHRYIVTSSGRGYSFVAAVEELPAVVHDRVTAIVEIEEEPAEPGGMVRPWLAAAAAVVVLAGLVGWWVFKRQPRVETVAVLPFKPLTAGSADPYLQVGIADALIARLGRLHRVLVRPLGSVRRYGREEQDPLAAGRELRVDAVLDGAIQRVGGKIRVTAQLLRVATGQAEWSGSFDSQAGDPLEIQDAMAAQIARALALRLSGSEQGLLERHDTENREALLVYLQARYHAGLYTRAGLKEGIAEFQRAIELDPGYALAFAGLADALNSYGQYEAPNQYIPQAEAAARRALELDETTAGAHATLGMILYRYRYDWPGAEREFRREKQLNPDDPSLHHKYGWYLSMSGRTDEALREFHQAVQLAPNTLVYEADSNLPYYCRGEAARGEAPLRHMLESNPKFVSGYFALGLTLMALHRWREAIETLEKGKPLDDDLDFLSALGVSYARLGERAEAQKYLERLRDLATRRYVSPASLGLVYLSMGEHAKAMEYLERGYEDRSWWMIFVKVDPRFDDLRSETGFQELVKRIGLS